MTATDFERYKQVGMTYVTRRWFFWPTVGIALLYGLLLALFLTMDGARVRDLLPMLAPTTAFFLFVLTHQAKHQFVTPAARLTPGYRAPHLAVLLAMAVALLALLPMGIAQLADLPPLGCLAFGSFVGGLLIYALHRMGLMMVVAVVFSYAAISPYANAWWLSWEPRWIPLRVAATILGWGLVCAWLRDLETLDEQSPRYRIPPLGAAFGRASRADRAEQRKQAARYMKQAPLQAMLSDRLLDRFLSQPRKRGELLRHGFMPLSSEWRAVVVSGMIGLIFWLIVEVAQYYLGTTGSEKDKYNVGKAILLQPIIFGLLMPGAFSMQLMVARRPLMESELLRPNTRREYFGGLFRAYYRDVALHALAFFVVAILLTLRIDRQHLTPANIACFALLVFVCNFFVASFLLWAVTFRLGVFQVMMPMLAGAPGIFVGLYALYHNDAEGATVCLIAAGLFVLASLALFRIARRRWLRIDLG